jgi:hypothetical protein
MPIEHGLAATLSAPLSTNPVTATHGLARASVWTATGLERQVFVDRSGRRGRHFGALGALLALLATVWLTALVTGSVGFSSLPALPSATANATPFKPAPHRAHLAVRGARVADRDTRHRAFKVAVVERPAPAKQLAGGAFGRLSGQIHLD